MNLFAYGTLMYPEVWDRVAAESCPVVPAMLEGHEARCLRGHPFPGLIEVPGGRTSGLLYRDVSAAAMARLDAYEDDFYVRVPLTILPADGGPETAEVYLMAPGHRNIVLDECWQPRL